MDQGWMTGWLLIVTSNPRELLWSMMLDDGYWLVDGKFMNRWITDGSPLAEAVCEEPDLVLFRMVGSGLSIIGAPDTISKEWDQPTKRGYHQPRNHGDSSYE